MNRRTFGKRVLAWAAMPAITRRLLDQDAADQQLAAESRQRGGGAAIPNLGEKITIRQTWRNSVLATAGGDPIYTLVLTVGSLSIFPDKQRLILGGRADDGTVYTLDLNLGKFTRQPDGSFLWTVT